MIFLKLTRNAFHFSTGMVLSNQDVVFYFKGEKKVVFDTVYFYELGQL